MKAGPGVAQGIPAADQALVRGLALGRGVEGVDDLVELVATVRAGWRGTMGRGRIEARRFVERVQVANVDHVRRPLRAAMVVGSHRLALPGHLLEPGGRGGRGEARIDDDLEPDIWGSRAVGDGLPPADDQTGDDRRSLGHSAGGHRRPVAQETVHVVVRNLERAVELVDRHERRRGDGERVSGRGQHCDRSGRAAHCEETIGCGHSAEHTDDDVGRKSRCSRCCRGCRRCGRRPSGTL